MTDIMFEAPSDDTIDKVIITADSVKNGSRPVIYRKRKLEQDAS